MMPHGAALWPVSRGALSSELATIADQRGPHFARDAAAIPLAPKRDGNQYKR
jgi:hypothetical protein